MKQLESFIICELSISLSGLVSAVKASDEGISYEESGIQQSNETEGTKSTQINTQHKNETHQIEDVISSNASNNAEVHCDNFTDDDDSTSSQKSLPENDEATKMAKTLNISEEILNYKPPMEFTFQINSGVFQKFYDFSRNEFVPGTWADMISDHITLEQKCCSFNATRPPQYNRPDGFKNFCILKGHCPCSLMFTVTINSLPKKGEDVVCNVKATGAFTLIQSIPTGRQVKGEKRKLLSQRLLHEKPGRVDLLQINGNTTLRYLHNNNQHKSIKVLQKIRHESRHASVSCKDAFEDINAFCEEREEIDKVLTVPGFVQEKNLKENEINIQMYTEASLRLLLGCHSSSNLTLHFDSTGSVVLNNYGKAALFYLALVKTNTGYSFPLASMISQTGKASDVSRLFLNIKRDIKKIRPNFNKPLVAVAVSDFSLAMLSSLCMGLNTQTMRDYIKNSYEIIQGNETIDKDRSVIFVCTPHIIRSFMRLLCKHVKAKKINLDGQSFEIRRVAVSGLAKIMSSRDLPEFATACRVFCDTFCTEKISNDRLRSNIVFITNSECPSADDIQNNYGHFEFDEIFPNSEHNTLKESSRFYILFRTLRDDKSIPHESDEENMFYNPGVADLFQNYYVQYAPFFCSMMLYATDRSTESRYSNSPVESEFNFVKNNFGGHNQFPINVFVRHIHEYHVGRVLRVLSTAASRDKMRKRKQKTILKRLQKSTLIEEDHVEVWKRRSAKRKPRYVGSKTVHTPKPNMDLLSQQKMVDDIFQFVIANAEKMEQLREQHKTSEITHTDDEQQSNTTTTWNPFSEEVQKKISDHNGKIEIAVKNGYECDINDDPDAIYLNGSIIVLHNPTRSQTNGTKRNVPVSDISHRDVTKLSQKMTEDFNQTMDEMDEIGEVLEWCEKHINAEFPSNSKNTDHLSFTEENKNSCKTDELPSSSISMKEKNIAPLLPDLKTTYSTVYARRDDLYMDSRHLQSFLDPNMWVETEHIDYCLRHANKKRGNEITVTRAAYIQLISRERNEWRRARKFQIPWDDDLTLLDVQNQNTHLHPLYMTSHFVLLHFKTDSRICVIYDSLMDEREKAYKGTLENDRKIIKQFALPDFFMDENEAEHWSVVHYKNMPQQTDAISCGIHVISAAIDIINGREIRNIPCALSARLAIVKDLISTTVEGQSLLLEANSDDKLVSLIKEDANLANEAYRLRQNRVYFPGTSASADTFHCSEG